MFSRSRCKIHAEHTQVANVKGEGRARTKQAREKGKLPEAVSGTGHNLTCNLKST